MNSAVTQINSVRNSAISAWLDCIGKENVSTDSQKISSFESATFKTSNLIFAILTPINTEQVQKCVRIANEHKIPLYPISQGKNWGYGSKVPASDGCVIISLEKMNKISDYSEDMAYITVEPGVTFQQVYDFLQDKESNLVAPGIGSTRNASLVGNALERGIGKGIYGDRFSHSCNMEIVLPNGEIINTGFGNIKHAESKNVYKWGLGPSVDGLFTQSNFGIVTKMTFWLTVKPKYFQVIFYTVKDPAQLEKAVDALRTLRLEGTITTTSTLSNAHRVVSMQTQFPFKMVTGDDIPLPQKFVEQIKKSALKGAAWVGDDAILSASKSIGKARAKRVKEVLGKVVSDLIIIDSTKAKLLKLLAKPIKTLTGGDVGSLIYFFHNSFYLGKPMEKQLAICYWRKKSAVPSEIDPDKDKCGVIWCSPSVPFNGEHVRNVLNILEDIYKKYGFEPNIGLNFMGDRGIAFTAAIIYDREVEGHDTKAMECYKELRDTLTAAGYPPYRLGIQSMDEMLSTSPEYVNFINKLKATIDPNNIISPNHYGIKGN